MSLENGVVRRTFDAVGAEWFLSAHGSGLLSELVNRGVLHPYHVELGATPLEVLCEPIELTTFPYEWTFSMLRDAALLTLEVTRAAWAAGFQLRDAPAFNVMFSDLGPRFVDLGSFRPGHTHFWFAFAQFCDHFLNPLALTHLTGLDNKLAWGGGLKVLPQQNCGLWWGES